MQQQPENASFCNLTDTMNNINNNKFNNGHDANNFMMGDDEMLMMQMEKEQEQHHEPIRQEDINDDNNNSNDNFEGPETDVDAIEDDFGAVGGGEGKEKSQMEFKETEDVADRVDIMNFGDDHSAAMFGTLENKVFEGISLQNPDIMKGNNPFSAADDMLETVEESVEKVVDFMDNKMMEHAEEMMKEMNEDFEGAAAAVAEELTSANEEVAIEQQPQAGELFKIIFTLLNGT
jgi:hypothetical protein